MAFDWVRDQYESTIHSFDGKIVLGYVSDSGDTKYTFSPISQLEIIKLLMENDGFPHKIVYIGRVKIVKSEVGGTPYPFTSEIDLSGVDYKKHFRDEETIKRVASEFKILTNNLGKEELL